MVTVIDPDNPIAMCISELTVTLDIVTQTASIAAAEVDSGSSDSCSDIVSWEVVPNVFTCDSVGLNTVTLTVADDSGNTATCTSTVTVEAGEVECCANGKGKGKKCRKTSMSKDRRALAELKRSASGRKRAGKRWLRNDFANTQSERAGLLRSDPKRRELK